MATNTSKLGCGLIGIGREWGFKESPVPPEQHAIQFLEFALNQSIHYYDTAPSYGLSEARLGKWLTSLTDSQRAKLTIATKFGEHWRAETQEPYVDHSYSALQASIDKSLERLGEIDILQLHKASPHVLKSNDLQRALHYARRQGITRFGASISDIESGILVCNDDQYEVVQIPLNQSSLSFLPIVKLAQEKGKTVVINRPFNMGKLVHSKSSDKRTDMEVKAFRFILERCMSGYILTGTKLPDHLRENINSFYAAHKSLGT